MYAGTGMYLTGSGLPGEAVERMHARPILSSVSLERGSGIALYRQIQHKLMDQIRSGAYKQSDPLPPVEEIANHFGVSLMTARQAVRSLCDLGVIYSQQGKGTFISRAKVEKNFRRVLSFTEEMKLRGSTSRSRVLSLRLCAPSREVRKALELKSEEKIYRLHRLRIADDVPMGVELSWLPAGSCPDLPQIFEPNASLYRTLAEEYGIQLHSANEVVEVGKATAEEARLLRISPRSPVFLFTRTSFLESGKPTEYVKSTFRGDRYQIVNRLTRLNAVLPGAPQGL
jgi:GntR family transcriptional regulator, N-acetylglucosamine utilization regulator